jgi:hypothetical protein
MEQALRENGDFREMPNFEKPQSSESYVIKFFSYHGEQTVQLQEQLKLDDFDDLGEIKRATAVLDEVLFQTNQIEQVTSIAPDFPPNAEINKILEGLAECIDQTKQAVSDAEFEDITHSQIPPKLSKNINLLFGKIDMCLDHLCMKFRDLEREVQNSIM